MKPTRPAAETSDDTMTLLVVFPGSAESSVQHVGSKASSLIRMAAAGHRVPEAGLVTRDADGHREVSHC
jgi:phosphoenolpyruvate synthase/pyruvate phosphate dikinase